MATGGNGVDEVAHEAFQGDTREDQGAVQERNQNESGDGGGVVALVDTARSWGSKCRSYVVEKYNKCWNRPVSQCSYIDGDPTITSYEVIYRSVIERSTMTPYPLRFQDPSHIITGISCQPKDSKTSSPEVEVISGGVGCKEVEILLTPVQKGDWACRVFIIGIADNRLETNPVPKQLTM